MTAFDKKVNQIAARHGWNISPVSGWYIPAYSIVPMDRKERDQITAALNRCKSFHVDVLQAFSACAWTCTILIRDRAEWEALQKHQRTADLLHSSTFHGMPPGCFSRGSGAVLFAVPEGGYTLHLTGLRSRCRALT